MSRRARLVFFAVAGASLAVALGIGLAGLPSFGAQLSAYARMLNELAPRQRHVTDVVSAIGFDYRGIDTLFEEFILLSAVASISVLLRPLSDETRRLPEDKAPDRTIPPPSPAVWLLAVFLSSLLLLTGLETVTHGQLTPGGGFQGGVVLASGLFVVYLGTNYRPGGPGGPGYGGPGGPGYGGGGPTTITCSSNNGKRNYCPANTSRGVRLTNQRSGSPCVQGQTWGYDNQRIWVDRGCRADFVTMQR